MCEIERELSLLAGVPQTVTFTAQVVPISRGIISTLYADLARPADEAAVLDIYRDFYPAGGFVRVFPSASAASIGTMQVRGTNYTDIVVSVDERNNRLRIVSIIDNLMKGQAGSALQNMNLLFGLPEKTGLDRIGIYP